MKLVLCGSTGEYDSCREYHIPFEYESKEAFVEFIVEQVKLALLDIDQMRWAQIRRSFGKYESFSYMFGNIVIFKRCGYDDFDLPVGDLVKSDSIRDILMDHRLIEHFGPNDIWIDVLTLDEWFESNRMEMPS